MKTIFFFFLPFLLNDEYILTPLNYMIISFKILMRKMEKKKIY